jgi:hypothetical protein
MPLPFAFSANSRTVSQASKKQTGAIMNIKKGCHFKTSCKKYSKSPNNLVYPTAIKPTRSEPAQKGNAVKIFDLKPVAVSWEK